MKWFVQACGIKNVRVFEINLIEVPGEILNKHGLTSGEKSRVIALMQELLVHLSATSEQATGIVDADCDRLLDVRLDNPLVLYTDFTCMEAYCFNELPMSKFIHVVLGSDEFHISELLTQYGVLMRELFLMRAANASLGLSLPWVSFEKCCKVSGSKVALDTEKYIRGLLQNSSAVTHEAAFRNEISRLRVRLSDDLRHHIHGHDLLALIMVHHGKQAKKRGLPNVDAVASAFRGCLEFEQLGNEALFAALSRRLGGETT